MSSRYNRRHSGPSALLTLTNGWGSRRSIRTSSSTNCATASSATRHRIGARTSASAIRRSTAPTNSSTRWPVWSARSASCTLNATSTVIVAFGIRAVLPRHVSRRNFWRRPLPPIRMVSSGKRHLKWNSASLCRDDRADSGEYQRVGGAKAERIVLLSILAKSLEKSPRRDGGESGILWASLTKPQ